MIIIAEQTVSTSSRSTYDRWTLAWTGWVSIRRSQRVLLPEAGDNSTHSAVGTLERVTRLLSCAVL